MPARLQLTGQTFGRLTVVRFSHMNKYRHSHWVCRCVCGGRTVVGGAQLRSGQTKSCGCLQPLAASAAKTTHGYSRTPIYRGWQAMRRRCTNLRAVDYYLYGARGIRVCRRWKKFENFLADMGPRPRNKTLDRIDPDGNYTPKNCRWATPRQQRMSQRKRT